MKAVLLTLALLVIVACAKQPFIGKFSRAKAVRDTTPTVCPTSATCVGKGGKCSEVVGAYLISTADCKYDLICQKADPTVYANYTGTCVTAPTAGQSCINYKSDSFVAVGECAENFNCNDDGTCEADSISPGYPCSGTNPPCLYRFVNNTQVTGACTNGVCQFTPDGQQCTYDNSCNEITSYCNTSDTNNTAWTCKPLSANGAACSFDSQTCLETCAPSSTTSTSGTCAEFFSLVAGSACTDASQCILGLYCPSGTSNFGVCTAPAASATLNKACTFDTDCAADVESCECNRNLKPVCTSIVYSKNAQGALNNLRNCLTKNKCTVNDESCIEAHCESQNCAFARSELGGEGLGCSDQCSAASSLVAPFFVLAALLAFLL